MLTANRADNCACDNNGECEYGACDTTKTPPICVVSEIYEWNTKSANAHFITNFTYTLPLS